MKKLLQVMLCVLLFGLFASAPAVAQDLININTATAQELTDLPGIGPVTAAKIVEYREAKPFDTVEEVLEVKGIGPAKFEAIKDRITVGAAAPAAPAAPAKE
ncbi:helix-hairpin-helix domain-containing protein [Desulfomicrobium sp. ZS1]|uniref:ComEA family DNA-binding protein n=1 Tax=Desulfomicrobium sp. ZS1 TaxID=2952228 RepID=UPI0020B22DF6|nr:helix-hairpin-helix domain-containing protein [Desulfomicrobium sp. ZS1]UTF50085.1 helix-hairpin-helix domain-containing protein [Desulfomicrobium sp. ZS1]